MSLAASIEGSPLAMSLRFSRWLYAAVNALHVFGIALLVGAVVPLDLKLLGAWTHIERRDLVRVLSPMAASGLCLAAVSGALLFSIRASEYLSNPFFLVKVGLILFATLSAGLAHWKFGAVLDRLSDRRARQVAILSICGWVGALFAGRSIAFVDG